MDNLLPICVFFFYLFFSPGGQLSKCVSASYKKNKNKESRSNRKPKSDSDGI